MQNPKVSIIIPVYNREKIISDTIDCAVNQTYNNLEIIIVDNCSTDNTWNILQVCAQNDQRLKIFKNDENLGPVLNWVKCLERISGDYCKILWSDDKMSYNFIKEALNIFDADTSFVISPVQIFDHDSGDTIKNITYNNLSLIRSEDFLFNQLIHNGLQFMVSPGCALFRSKDLIEALIVDIPNTDDLDFKKYGAGNDLLIFLITATKYPIVKVARDTLSLFRSHKDSISMEKQDEINLYYEWSKSHFLKVYNASLADDFKSKLFLKKIVNSKLKNLYDSTVGRVGFINLMKAGYRKIIYKE